MKELKIIGGGTGNIRTRTHSCASYANYSTKVLTSKRYLNCEQGEVRLSSQILRYAVSLPTPFWEILIHYMDDGIFYYWRLLSSSKTSSKA